MTGQKLLRLVACFGIGTMVAVLEQVGTTAWARGRLKDPSQLFCTGSEHPAWNAFKANSFVYIHSAKGRAHMTGGECELQIAGWEILYFSG